MLVKTVPKGRSEPSPTLQCWVGALGEGQVPEGRLNGVAETKRSTTGRSRSSKTFLRCPSNTHRLHGTLLVAMKFSRPFGAGAPYPAHPTPRRWARLIRPFGTQGIPTIQKERRYTSQPGR
jgi:hypothetical protein